MRHLHAVPDASDSPPKARLPTTDPNDAMRTMFGRLDEMNEGLTQEEQLEVAATMYFDADGNPRAHSLNKFHAVTDE